MTARRPSLLFYCQPSLGVGHLSRAFALCDSLSQRFDVVLVCGGRLPDMRHPPNGVEVVALPPISAAVNGQLINHDRGRSLEHTRELRKWMILETFRSVRPEVLLIEFFPFGKQRFAGEILALLDEARSLVPTRPVVACSVRDILVGRGREQATFDDRAGEVANRYFDAVMVHSDPEFARLEETFRPRVWLRTPVHYTGFVVSNGASGDVRAPRIRNGVVVSAGGGLVGAPLLFAAIEAQRLSGDTEMTIIAGPYLPETEWQVLKRRAEGRRGLVLRRSVPNLAAELRAASASISQCGYNTALDVVQAGVPALVVPFVENGEDEQTKRALRLQKLGAVRMLHPSRLTPQVLADELRALPQFRPTPLQLNLGGGPATVSVLDELHARRFAVKVS